jgi:hypothetical protein
VLAKLIRYFASLVSQSFSVPGGGEENGCRDNVTALEKYLGGCQNSSSIVHVVLDKTRVKLLKLGTGRSKLVTTKQNKEHAWLDAKILAC